MLNKFLPFCLFLLIAFCGKGQDAHFSQFYTAPYALNPSLTGAINGTYRMVGSYRDQWSGGLENPFNTLAMGGDVNFKIGEGVSNRSKDQFGVGLLFVSDRVNTIHLNNNEISLFGAYQKALDNKGNQTLGVGFKMGVVQKNINYDNLVFGDSYNQIDGYTLPSGEILPPNNFGFMDISMGLNYRSINPSYNRFHIGVAAHHLTRPNVSFYTNISNPNPDLILENKLEMRLVSHVGLDQILNEFVELQPRIIFQKQGVHQEFNLGTNLKYNFIGFNRSVYFGLWARVVKDFDAYTLESLTPLIGIQTGSFIMGVSYDVNVGEISNGNAGFNALELTFRFIGEHDNDSAYCPEF